MPEPIDAPVRRPEGGWPGAEIIVRTLEQNTELALYHLACTARRMRMGVHSTVRGVELTVWPHQTMDELVREHRTLARALAMKAMGMKVEAG